VPAALGGGAPRLADVATRLDRQVEERRQRQLAGLESLEGIAEDEAGGVEGA
jgi:hypothetical protein